jgi:hypothetical protein
MFVEAPAARGWSHELPSLRARWPLVTGSEEEEEEEEEVRVVLDGGPGAEPPEQPDAWLVSDDHGELMPSIRRLARRRALEPAAGAFSRGGLSIEPRPAKHTSHPTWGYLISDHTSRAVWAPEFWDFPDWATGAHVMFAEAAGWSRPVRFAGGVGGHAAALEVARRARASGVRRLVLAHIGRPTIRAMDAGEQPPFGEFGVEGRAYDLMVDQL